MIKKFKNSELYFKLQRNTKIIESSSLMTTKQWKLRARLALEVALDDPSRASTTANKSSIAISDCQFPQCVKLSKLESEMPLV